MSLRHKSIVLFFIFTPLAFLAHLFFPTRVLASGAGYSEYYIPGDEDNMNYVLDDIGRGDQSGDMHAIISVTAWSNNTTVYYDHWENGYNFDPDHPVSTADETYTLTNKGDSHIFESSNIPTNPRGTDTYYDGMDRIYVAGGAVTVSRASWTEAAGTLLAVAWEVYPVRPQLTTYIMPFGEDMAANNPPNLQDFERVYALIQATANNTTVTVDMNGDGTADELDTNRDGTPDATSVTLNEGEVFLLDRVSGVNPITPLYSYDFESGAQGFTVGAADGSPSMNWELGDPQTISPPDSGKCSSNCHGGGPDDDHTAAGTDCWGTDLDDLYSNGIGNIYLYSPVYDFTGKTDIVISYWEWLEIEGNNYDLARFQYSTDGGSNWNDAWVYGDDSSEPSRTDTAWSKVTFDASAYADNQASVQWRWALHSDSGWEWGGWYIDDVVVGQGHLGLNTGTTIKADKTVQVQYVVGDQGSNYEVRGLSAFPRGFWDNEYYAPVHGGDPAHEGDTDIYLYNPHDTALTINYETGSANGTFSIPSKTSSSFFQKTGSYVPTTSAVNLSATDVFWGISIIDTSDGDTDSFGTGRRSDWGYSLVPAFMLDKEHYMGWAPGSFPVGAQAGNHDPDSDSSTDSGVYISPAADNVRIYVDRDNDGTAENFYDLNHLSSQYVYDSSDGDMSDASIYATGPYTAAYGQNPDTSAPGAPAIDVGYTALPGTNFIDLVLTVDKSVSPQVVSTASGSTADFTLDVKSYDFPADGIEVVDALPDGWEFVNNSAVITLADMTQLNGAAANPTITGSGPYTLAWPASLLGSMGANQEIKIVFSGRTTQTFSVGDLSRNLVDATGTRTVEGVDQTFDASDSVFISYGDITVNKTSSATDPLSPGDQYTYTVTVTNPATAAGDLTNIAIYDQIPDGVHYLASSASVTAPNHVSPIRATEYYIGAGDFTGTTYNLTLNQNLAPDYFVMIRGADGDGTANTNTGPDANYPALTADPFGTGDLAASSANNVITMTRHAATDDWIGVVTVVECVNNQATDGFQLLSVERVSHPANGTSGTDTSATAWSDINQVMLMGGFYGAGCDTTETSNNNMVTCWARIWPSGTDTINWSRNAGGATLSAATSTVMVLSWGSNWTVQRVEVTGTNGGNGVDAAGEYNTAALGTSVARANTWVWGTGFTDDNGLGDGGEGVVVTLGDGVTQNGTENTVAAATEYSGTSIDFEVYALTHADIAVDYKFKPDGDTNALTVDVPVDSAASNRMALSYNTCNGTGTAFPRPLFSARYTTDTNVRLERRRSGQPFAAWVQGIAFSIPASGTSVYPGHVPPNFVTTSDGYILSPGETLTLVYDVMVDDPLATGIDSITNTASATTAEIKTPISASVTDTVVNPSSSSAKAGDRVWLDTNGDGVQDVGESGLSNVEVTLKDQYGTPIATATTDTNGNYLFDGVTPDTGYYVEVTDGLPSGLVQSYPAGHSDNKTDPFDLVAGQTYSDADLGYTGDSSTATIGDFVWSDADGDGSQDSGEPGISGVSVQIYLDDGDGTFEPGGDDGSAIDTQVTDSNGKYYFTNLTASGTEDYWVVVDTSQSALNGYTATTGTLQYAENVNAGDVLLTHDFGFQNPDTYSITDRVWFDPDEDGNDDNGTTNAESGISDVSVNLLDASGNVIASTTTDANGYFTFSGLAGNGADYTVKITDTAGKLTDYYGTTTPAQNGEFAVNNLNADIDYTAEPSEPNFGYNLYGSIGDTVFNDADGSGVQDSGEAGIASVSIDLYTDDGDGVFEPGGDDGNSIATLTTDSDGNYIFSGLDDGTYWVDIDNTQTALSSYDILTTADDDTSASGHQRLVTISGGGSDLSIDYGYRASVQRSVSGALWDDADHDGAQNNGEIGIAGVTVDILDGSTVINSATTDSNGDYSFTGLPPGTYTVRITDNDGILTDYDTTYEVTEGANASSYDGEESVNLAGADKIGIDFGYYKPVPTYALIGSFAAEKTDGHAVVVWTTTAEVGCAGFYLDRENGPGDYRPVSASLIPSVMTPAGGTYRVIDPQALSGSTYTYRLIELEFSGHRRVLGLFTVTVSDSKKAGTHGIAGYETTATPRMAACRDGKKKMSFSRNLYRSAGPADRIKLVTSDSGIYAVSAGDMAQGFGIAEDAAAALTASERLYLTSDGGIVPVLPFTDNTGIYFYAKQADTIYTDKRVFWLHADFDGEKGDINGDGHVDETDFNICMAVLNGRSAAGLRPDYAGSGADVNGNFSIDMAEAAYISAIANRNKKAFMASSPAVSAAGDIRTLIPATRHYEQDLFDKTDLFSDPNADYWFWTFVIPGDPDFGTADIPMEIDSPAPGGFTATLSVNLYGMVNYPGPMDYHARLMLNGVSAGEYTWDGLAPHTLTASIDSSLLTDGENTLVIEGVAGDPATPGIFAVDSVDLEYERTATAVNDRLDILPGSTAPLDISGFSGPEILALDVTDPSHPVRISGPAISGTGTEWSMELTPENAEASYTLAGPGGVFTPKIVPFHLRNELLGDAGADYLIIAADDLVSGASVLAGYRAARGFTPMIVSVSEIYDTFGHGVKDPNAIFAFIKHAFKNWSPAPEYVVLVGDGTYDYKDHLHMSDNLIPVLMVPTPEGLFASDSEFVDFNDDDIPDIPIGRIAVTTSAELSVVIDKIGAFEADTGTRDILMVADRADNGGDFPSDSDSVASLAPLSYPLDRIYISGSTSPAGARARLIDDINKGAFMLNYIGHGGIDRISNSSLLKAGDESLLDNTGHYPVMIALTCLAGRFSAPGFDSLIEDMMAAPGSGFVAGWAPTGLSSNSGAVELNKYLFKETFTQNAKDMGSAVIGAIRQYREAGGSAGLPMVYNLLGDPALRLNH